MIQQLVSPLTRNFGTTIIRRQHRIAATTSLPYISPINITRSLASLPLQHEEEEPAQNSVSHSLLILGKPGGGKGTISKKILNDFPQFRHVSTGDELRQHVRNGTELGKEAKKYMDGKYIFDCIVFCAYVMCTISYLVSSQYLNISYAYYSIHK